MSTPEFESEFVGIIQQSYNVGELVDLSNEAKRLGEEDKPPRRFQGKNRGWRTGNSGIFSDDAFGGWEG